jgi:hypothetical protein
MARYTPSELDDAALRDLLSDAEGAERQAKEGPFYPSRGVTAESMQAYAASCRAKIASLRNGGAHLAVLAGDK